MRRSRWAGKAARTINYYRGAAHSFAEWAIRAELLNRNPVTLIDRRDEKADRLRERRALTMNEATGCLLLLDPETLY